MKNQSHNMKKYIHLFLFVASITLNAQLSTNSNTWKKIGDTEIRTIYDDENNADGLNDGALHIDGITEEVGQGVKYIFTGEMNVNQDITISTFTYNPNSSFVKYRIELYNATDNRILVFKSIVINGNDSIPVNTILSYTPDLNDAGDNLELRYVRNDDGHVARDFAIDNVTFNGQFLPPTLSCLPKANNWETYGKNVVLRYVNEDPHEIDDLNDGAIIIDGQTPETNQGITYTFDCQMNYNEQYSLETVLFNPNSSFVNLEVELYNLTDKRVLTSSTVLFPSNSINFSQTILLSYATVLDDVGDILQLRMIRTDDGNISRDFAIDTVLFNGTFLPPTKNCDLYSSGTWNVVGDHINLSYQGTIECSKQESVTVDATQSGVGQGIEYIFGCTTIANQQISIKNQISNPNNSFVKLIVDLFNSTDNQSLSSSEILINGGDTDIKEILLNYQMKDTDEGDILKLRFLRNDDGHIARDFTIHNVTINEVNLHTNNCHAPELTPDIPLEIPPTGFSNQMESIFESAFIDYFEDTDTINLTTANESYIAVKNYISSVSGSQYLSFNNVEITKNGTNFLKVYAKYLKEHPNDLTIKDNFNDIVRIISKALCSNIFSIDYQGYYYEDFARPVIFSQEFLTEENQHLFSYTLYEHTNGFEHFWESNYFEFQPINNAINTDLIYNLGDVMLLYGSWLECEDEQYRYMKGFKRFMDRFLSYSLGTADGLKKDGTGFHHWSASDNYMYAFTTTAKILKHLSQTDFQIKTDSYLRFRDALYTQMVLSNNSLVKAHSMVGRSPNQRKVSLECNGKSIENTAFAGQYILGISEKDPILIDQYNRIWNNNQSGVKIDGYFQFNHANSGVYRKNNWLAVNKGFSYSLWGSEIYKTENRYGRYQSYGALEIIYPGTEENNGYYVNSWNWNYNPGTTSKVLSWDKLRAERVRIDERQEFNFAGALAFKKKNNQVLPKTTGTYGMFAMKFQELMVEDIGWTPTSDINFVNLDNSHDVTFRFLKSTFTFDDIIICLGSNINNDDSSNPTITTLYQRLDNSSNSVNINDNNRLTANDDNWIIDNYKTGFYIFNNNDSVNLIHEIQDIPCHNEIIPISCNNLINKTFIGYINHGTNPVDKEYEYVCIPDATSDQMINLKNNKPYLVHQKNKNAHILEYMAQNIWGYVFFEPNSIINNLGIIKANSAPCLVMYQQNTPNSLLLNLTNPDVGYKRRKYEPSQKKNIQLTLKGIWNIDELNIKVSYIHTSDNNTIIEFETVDGLPIEISLSKNNSSKSFKSLIQDNQVSVALYPNPTTGFVNIHALKEVITSIKIINLQGQVLDAFEQSNRKLIDLNKYSNGIYFIQLENSEYKGTYKVIVKH